MAQAQRRPEQERPQTAEQTVEQFRQIVEQVRRTQLTPQQVERMKQFIEELNRMLQTQPAGRTGTSPAPGVGQVPAPRRIEQFVYDVNVSGTTYRLTLSERLPTDRQGRVDAVAARRRLHEALLHNEPAPLGGHMSASVQMAGNSQEAREFNSRPQNYQMDVFRDRYLTKSYKDGEYVPNNDITIAQIQAQRPRGG